MSFPTSKSKLMFAFILFFLSKSSADDDKNDEIQHGKSVNFTGLSCSYMPKDGNEFQISMAKFKPNKTLDDGLKCMDDFRNIASLKGTKGTCGLSNFWSYQYCAFVNFYGYKGLIQPKTLEQFKMKEFMKDQALVLIDGCITCNETNEYKHNKVIFRLVQHYIDGPTEGKYKKICPSVDRNRSIVHHVLKSFGSSVFSNNFIAGGIIRNRPCPTLEGGRRNNYTYSLRLEIDHWCGIKVKNTVPPPRKFTVNIEDITTIKKPGEIKDMNPWDFYFEKRHLEINLGDLKYQCDTTGFEPNCPPENALPGKIVLNKFNPN